MLLYNTTMSKLVISEKTSEDKGLRFAISHYWVYNLDQSTSHPKGHRLANKLVVLAVVVQMREGRLQVLTQLRTVINQAYDPLYDGTQEVMGETAVEWEGPLDTLLRGLREELGTPGLGFDDLIIVGGGADSFTTHPGEDAITGITPYYYVQQVQGPQPWAGPVFVVRIPDNMEPQLDTEGEVGGFKWWDPEDLLAELRAHPEHFMGLHFPALLKVCQALSGQRRALRYRLGTT